MSVPSPFNLAHYCLGAAPHRDPAKDALLIIHSLDEAPECWSYGALDDTVRRIAGGLKAKGLEPGSRIMIRMENKSAVPLLFFGANAAGLIPVPTSPQLTPHEARFLLKDSGAALLAVSDTLALEGIPHGTALLREEEMADLMTADPIADYPASDPEDPAFLVYTSGTSGTPKGVLHAQRNVWGRRPMIADWLGLTARDRILHAGAFNWTYTLGAGLMDPWSQGATSLFYNGPKDPGIWPRLIERFGATLFAAVPSVYRQILKYADLGAHDLSTLRHGLTAGEALSPALAATWKEKAGTDLYEAFGMSEISTFISTRPGTPITPGSPGRPQTGRKIAVLPIDGGTEPLPAGETGALAIHRSDPGLMLRYWTANETDADKYRGEWFLGGDLAAMDADGTVWFKGRSDGVMNALGYRVAPEEVEAALASHPQIGEVGVTEIQVRDDLSLIAAFIVPRDPKTPPTPDAIRAHAAQHLAAYKVPREIFFVDVLPRTANGKVIRKALKSLI